MDTITIDGEALEPPHDEPFEKLLDLHELSRIVRLSESSLHKRIQRRGDVPTYIVVGEKSYRWRPSDVARWLDEHEVSPGNRRSR